MTEYFTIYSSSFKLSCSSRRTVRVGAQILQGTFGFHQLEFGMRVFPA